MGRGHGRPVGLNSSTVVDEAASEDGVHGCGLERQATELAAGLERLD